MRVWADLLWWVVAHAKQRMMMMMMMMIMMMMMGGLETGNYALNCGVRYCISTHKHGIAMSLSMATPMDLIKSERRVLVFAHIKFNL